MNPMLQNNLDRFYKRFTFSHFPFNINSSSSSAVSFASVAPSSNSSLFKELVKNSTQTNETKNKIYTNYSSTFVPVGPPNVGESVVRTKAAFDVTSSSFLSNSGGSNDRKKQESSDGCNIFDGEWVWVEDRVPYYPPGSCPYIEEGSNYDCYKNGRIDQRFLKWKWQWQSQQTNSGYNNNIPSILNATDFLERLRGKKVAFAGDSLNRNMFSSLTCILWNAVAGKSKVYWLHGGALLVRFEDYNCTIGFVRSPFLVYETQPLNRITQKSKIQPRPESMRLDLIDPYASAYYLLEEVLIM
ncbi:protein trichome birefringence-like 2 [Papaver somniferum]|uniref:protein trichome birefringence-like 2 n=1 Tax=Papaver somniferum TaxID=3469 RepID=UPI000E6FB5A7|nr:protein trichome birefringence-like 2 [Papaver somniferum]